MPGFCVDPWPVYASADLFVLSSDYEGYGNVLLEAMFSGVTVISTDCQSGPREILDEGRYGRLVPVGEVEALAQSMIDSLENPDSAESLKERAQELSAGALNAHREVLLRHAETARG
jgi:glycosyltransferase involved in cell wall biosynthesis